jgi:hypothetical protein
MGKMKNEPKQVTPESGEDITPDKPDLPRWIFWDVPFDKLIWGKEYIFIIVRVIERGKVDVEWQ